jgi:hypothetical protein
MKTTRPVEDHSRYIKNLEHISDCLNECLKECLDCLIECMTGDSAIQGIQNINLNFVAGRLKRKIGQALKETENAEILYR